MKTIKIFLLFCMLMVLAVSPVKGSHLLGADIGWNYIGSDTFLVWIDAYRDCNGVPMQEQPFYIYPCGSATGTYITTLISSGMDVTPLCKNYCSRCSDPTCSLGLGIEQYRFTAKVNLKSLDSSCCNFKIVWQSCCRANSITTGSQGEQYYVDAMVDRCKAPADNSPVFNVQPVMVFNLDQCLTFDFGCTDPDIATDGFQDSLVYSLDYPLQDAAVPVNYYYPAYGYDHPLKYSGNSPSETWNPPDHCNGFHLDSSTGMLRFKATREDITVMNIKVEEWGKDPGGKPFLKGYTHRDVDLFPLQTEPNSVPLFSGINGSDTFAATFCTGSQSCFYMDVADADVSDSDKVTPLIPQSLLDAHAHITVTKGVKHPRSLFCWQPSDSEAGKTYQFVLSAQDNACPINGRSSITYTIHVIKSPDAQIIANNDGCGNVSYTASASSGQKLKYLWAGDDQLSESAPTFTHHYKTPGKYRYRLTVTNAGGCSNSDSGEVNIAPYVVTNVRPHDTLFCQAGPTNISIRSNASGGIGPYTYTWRSGSAVLPYKTANITIPITQDTIIIVYVTDMGSGCTNWDTVNIKSTTAGSSIRLIPPANTTFCYHQTQVMEAAATGGNPAHYRFSWEFKGTQFKGSKIVLQAASSDTLHVSVTDGCTTDSEKLYLYVAPPLQLALMKDTGICYGDAILLNASGSGGHPAFYKYSWSPSLDTAALEFIRPGTTETYTVTLEDGCSESVSKSVTVAVKPVPSAGFAAQQTTIQEGQAIQFNNSSKGAAFYRWDFGDGNNSTIESPSHIYTDTGSFAVSLTAINTEGCSQTSSVANYIHVLQAFRIWMPNTFTPNEDALNECFTPIGQDYKQYTLQIFNRLGQMVYKGHTCWNGTYKGVNVMEGEYWYILTVTAEDGSMHKYSGDFYLLR